MARARRPYRRPRCRNLADTLGQWFRELRADKGTTSTGTSYMKGNTALACNVGNILLALDREAEITNAFGYDEMLRAEILLRPLFADEPNFRPRPLTDG